MSVAKYNFDAVDWQCAVDGRPLHLVHVQVGHWLAGRPESRVEEFSVMPDGPYDREDIRCGGKHRFDLLTVSDRKRTMRQPSIAITAANWGILMNEKPTDHGKRATLRLPQTTKPGQGTTPCAPLTRDGIKESGG